MNEQIANLINEIENEYECTSFSSISSYLNVKIIEIIINSNLESQQKEDIIQRYAMYKITAIEALESCYTLN